MDSDAKIWIKNGKTYYESKKSCIFASDFSANHNKDYSVVKTSGSHRPLTVGFFLNKSHAFHAPQEVYDILEAVEGSKSEFICQCILKAAQLPWAALFLGNGESGKIITQKNK